MDQGRRPVPDPNHGGSPPQLPPLPPDVRVPGIMVAFAFLTMAFAMGVMIFLFDGDLAESMIAGALFGILYQLCMLVQSLRSP